MEELTFHLEKVVKAKTDDLEDFTGPLDLILSLLSKNKMEIKDIQISLILEQYLDWMDRRKALDLDVASEFVTMAAHLVYIKTRMLLSINDEEAMSEMEQLIASLEEHQRQESYLKIKAVAPHWGTLSLRPGLHHQGSRASSRQQALPLSTPAKRPLPSHLQCAGAGGQPPPAPAGRL